MTVTPIGQTPGGRALLSGARSPIAEICLAQLRARGWSVKTCGRHERDDFRVDFSTPLLPRGLQGLGPTDVFIHFAGANELVCRHAPDVAQQVNVLGAARAAELCDRHGIKAAVLISTRHVFGPATGRVDEDSPPQPSSLYGHTKAEGEKRFIDAAGSSGLDFRILRLPNCFAASPDPVAFTRWSLLPYAFCRAAVTQREIRLESAGTHPLSLLPISVITNLLADWPALPALRHATTDHPMRVVDFAAYVAQIATDILGHTVHVRVPDPHSNLPPSGTSIFGTKYETFPHEPELRRFVADMITLLHRRQIDKKETI